MVPSVQFLEYIWTGLGIQDWSITCDIFWALETYD